MIKKGAIHGSGFGCYPFHSGWINVFFPLWGGDFSRLCKPYKNTEAYGLSGLNAPGNGMGDREYPNGLSMADVKWTYYQTEYDLKFVSGFFGSKLNKTNKELSPLIGWIIAEKQQDKEKIKT